MKLSTPIVLALSLSAVARPMAISEQSSSGLVRRIPTDPSEEGNNIAKRSPLIKRAGLRDRFVRGYAKVTGKDKYQSLSDDGNNADIKARKAEQKKQQKELGALSDEIQRHNKWLSEEYEDLEALSDGYFGGSRQELTDQIQEKQQYIKQLKRDRERIYKQYTAKKQAISDRNQAQHN